MANTKMNFNAPWAMAVGGMVGGGIFSVLGVIIQSAGEWAWLSFVIAGLIALISAHSYSQLSILYSEGGGAFTFLRKINHKGFATSPTGTDSIPARMRIRLADCLRAFVIVFNIQKFYKMHKSKLHT